MKSYRLLAFLLLISPMITNAQPQTYPQRGTHVDKWTNPDGSPFFWSIKQLRDITNLLETATSFAEVGLTQRVTVSRFSTSGGPRFLESSNSLRVEYENGVPVNTNSSFPNPNITATFDESFAQGIATRNYSDGSSWFRVRTSDAVIRWHDYDTNHCGATPVGLTATVASLWRLPEQHDPPWLTLTKNVMHPGDEVQVPLPRRLGGFLFCMDFQSCLTCDGSVCDRWEPLTPPPAMSASALNNKMSGSPAGITMGAKGPKVTMLGITGDTHEISKSTSLTGPWNRVGELTIGEEAIGTWEDQESVRGAAFYQIK